MKVKQAAIKDGQGVVHTLPPPARHHTIIGDCNVRLCADSVQGFVLEDGTFVDRKEAARCAVESGQIDKPQYVDDELFSEDLW